MSIPTVNITDNLAGTANRATGSIAYTLTFSEPVTGLTLDDFVVSNGTATSLSGGGSTWTVHVTPALDVASGSIGLTLIAGAVSAASGEVNAIASNSGQAIDTLAPTAAQLVTGSAFKSLADPQVTLQTSKGTLVLELHPDQAPVTVANMLAYADDGFYDGTLFHRVIEGFMVQGGGFTPGLVNKPPTEAPILLESNNGLSNTRGTIAMARTSDPNSATSQFFINQVDNLFLNYSSTTAGYAVFGHVLSGLTVVDSIAQVATTTQGSYSDVPVTNVTINALRQTAAGILISNAHTLQVGQLEAGASWAYSLDGGNTWNPGSGNSITLPTGEYAAGAIQVRQTDGAGNTSVGQLGAALVITDQELSTPTVSITDNLVGTAHLGSGSITYTLTFSEAVTGLAAEDFIVSQGSVSGVSGSGTTWTVNVTPEVGVASGSIGLTLRSGAVLDATGAPNAVTSHSSQAIDTIAPVAPKLVTSSAFDFQVNPQISMQTSLGTVVFELRPEQAPITVANMLAYADAGFYDGTLFHQVVPGFVLQGGSYTPGLVYQEPIYKPIALESNNGLSHVRGSLAMVRGSTASSATTQFFIDLLDNPNLNYSSASSPGYAVFGQIVTGLSVIDSIAQVPTATSPAYVPLNDVTITSIRQTQAGSAVSRVNSLQISDLETGATWSYSLDAGLTWQAGSGTSLLLPDGTYGAQAIQIRQTDAAGNVSAGTGKLGSALVVDATAPTVTSFNPAQGAIGIPLDGNIVLTFSETVVRGSGTIVLKTAAGALVESFDAATSDRLTLSGATLTINPSADLTYLAGYTLEFAAGTFKDLVGNAYAGTTGYHFTTNHPASGQPGIDGIPAPGQTLSANTSALTDVDGLGTFSYQWQADGDDIPGATAATLLIGPDETGKAITLQVSYSDGRGTRETVTSAAVHLGTNSGDTLSAGSDADRLVGGAGNDIYQVTNGGNAIVELADAGTDTVRAPLSWTLGAHLENLELTGTSGASGIGNNLDNTLTGNDGNNILDGGIGADTLIGGAGNDTYVVDNSGDGVHESSGMGNDTVLAAVNWTLGDHLENLVLTGTRNLSGTGNDLDNRLTGNGGANALNGGAGNDVLDGASGHDTLTGGTGADTFAFTTPLHALRNVDTLTDFVSGTDKLHLSSAIFRELGFSGAPGSGAFFHVGHTAHDADDRILYNPSTGALSYDADGTGTLAAVQFAVLNGAPVLLYTDFSVG